MSEEIPYGYCHCGCGLKTTIAKQTRAERGVKRGEPTRYITGHGLGPPRVVNMGERFGRLVVVSKDGKHFICVCDCGNERRVQRSNLIEGRTRSCGCWSNEMANTKAFKHGHARINNSTLTYRVWGTMLDRCCNANNSHYKWYGARGITVCERWYAFENFLADMGRETCGALHRAQKQ